MSPTLPPLSRDELLRRRRAPLGLLLMTYVWFFPPKSLISLDNKIYFCLTRNWTWELGDGSVAKRLLRKHEELRGHLQLPSHMPGTPVLGSSDRQISGLARQARPEQHTPGSMRDPASKIKVEEWRRPSANLRHSHVHTQATTNGAGSGSMLCWSQYLEGRGKHVSVNSRPASSYTVRPHPKKQENMLRSLRWGLLDFLKLLMRLYHTTCPPVGIPLFSSLKAILNVWVMANFCLVLL